MNSSDIYIQIKDSKKTQALPRTRPLEAVVLLSRDLLSLRWHTVVVAAVAHGAAAHFFIVWLIA